MQLEQMMVENREMLRGETQWLEVLIYPAAARVLEMRSKTSGRHALGWRPMNVGNPAGLGGWGPVGELASLGWQLEETEEECLLFVLEQEDGLRAEAAFALDRPGPLLDLAIVRPPETGELPHLRIEAETVPGWGGELPRETTGIIHGRHVIRCGSNERDAQFQTPMPLDDRLYMPLPNEPKADVVEHWAEPFETWQVGPRDGGWATITDSRLPQTVLGASEGRVGAFLRHISGIIYAEQQGPVLQMRLAVFDDLRRIEAVYEDLVVAIEDPPREAGEAVDLAPVTLVNLVAEPAEHTMDGDEIVLMPGERWSVAKELFWCEWYGGQAGDVRPQVDGGLPLIRGRRQVSEIEELRERSRQVAAEADGLEPGRRAVVLGTLRRIGRDLEDKDSEALPDARRLVAEMQAMVADERTWRPYFSPDDIEAMRAYAAKHLDLRAELEQLRSELDDGYAIPFPCHREYDVPKRQGHAANEALAGALVCAASGDQELAELTARRIEAFVECWEQFGAIRWETIHNSVMITPLIIATDLLLSLGTLDAERAGRFYVCFLDLAEVIHDHQTGGRGSRSMSNWKAMEYASLATLGALHPYHPRAQTWLAEGRETYWKLLVMGCFTDGAFWEQSLGYHQVTLRWIYLIAEGLLRAGEDLFTTKQAGRNLSEMVAWAARLALAPGHGPRFHDSASNLHLPALMNAAKRCQSESAAALVRAAGWEPSTDDLFVPIEPPAKEAARLTSFVTEPSGKAVLRDRSTDSHLALNFGPHPGGHSHWNRLSFELWSGGRTLVPDSGTYRYEERLHLDWFKHTISHNTVTLGDELQSEREGRLISFESDEDAGTACVEVEAQTYPGITHRRRIEMRPGELLFTDWFDGAPGPDIVWRMNSFEQPRMLDAEDLRDAVGGLAFERGGRRLTALWYTEGLQAEVAEVPLMGEEIVTVHDEDHIMGHQLRLRRAAADTGEQFRVLLRIEEV